MFHRSDSYGAVFVTGHPSNSASIPTAFSLWGITLWIIDPKRGRFVVRQRIQKNGERLGGAMPLTVVGSAPRLIACDRFMPVFFGEKLRQRKIKLLPIGRRLDLNTELVALAAAVHH